MLTEVPPEAEAGQRVLVGRCQCGAVGYRVEDAFVYASNCHCSKCRAATGSAFKPFAGIEREKLEITDGADRLLILGDDRLNDTRCCACGSLLFSVVVRPKIQPERLGLVSLALGVATSVALKERKQANRLKWPNDIVTRGRKLGGVLCEAEISGGKVVFVVGGVGVNMRITRDQFPRELKATATSCVIETGRSYDRAEVLAGILIHLDPALKDLSAGRYGNIVNTYRHLCDTLGKTVAAVIDGEKVKATAVDIDEFGGLVLDTGDVIPTGDVTHLE